MKRRISNLMLVLLLVVCALPIIASASSVQVSNKGCDHRASYEKRVDILEPGTCQEPGKVKYECDYSLWYIFGTYYCEEEWVKEEITITCHPTEVEEKEATCSEPGNTAGLMCSDCGWDKTRCAYCAEHMCEIKSEIGHTEVAKPDTPPTCVKTGTDGGTWCSVCNTIIQEPTVVDATGIHDYSVFVKNLVKPTCVQKSKDLYKCSTCDGTQERESVFGTHAYDLQRYQVDKAPTCTTGGVGVFKCKYCNIPEVGITVDPLGHDKQYSTLKAPTCTEEGWRIVTCGREGCDYETAEKVAANGHTFETPVAGKAATCTTDGYTAHKKCNDCDETEGKEVIDTDGHKFVNYICSKCGVRDGSCLHENASITTTKEATCKATGTRTFKCPDCGDTFVETLPRLNYHNYVNGTCTWCRAESCNHSYTTERVEPTCTEPGYTKSVCTICGKTTNERALAALNHNYDNKVVDGFCTRCGCPNPNAQKPENNKKTGELTLDLQNIFALG